MATGVVVPEAAGETEKVAADPAVHPVRSLARAPLSGCRARCRPIASTRGVPSGVFSAITVVHRCSRGTPLTTATGTRPGRAHGLPSRPGSRGARTLRRLTARASLRRGSVGAQRELDRLDLQLLRDVDDVHHGTPRYLRVG